MSLLAQLLKDAGLENAPRSTVAGRFLSAEGVYRGPEFERIAALPRWSWRDAQDLEELQEEMTRRFRKPEGDGKLNLLQAVGLYCYIVYGRLCVVANVGTGKTLLSALVPTAGNHTRPLHITYAKLQRKTQKEFAVLSKNWRVHPDFTFISAEKLSRAESADFLAELDPDVVLVDESHLFKSARSGRSKRMSRHLKSHEHCKFVPLTGTPGDDSIQNVSHIQEWVHRDGSPLPRTYNELLQWSQALDPVVTLRRNTGVLEEFLPEGCPATLENVRKAVGTRCEQTQGNVFHRNNSEVQCSLYLDAVISNDYPQVVEDFFGHVRKHETAPDGREFEEIQVHNALVTGSLGFYRVFKEQPPKDWRLARAEWRRFVSEICSRTKYELDTPHQVAKLCRNGQLDSAGVFDRWVEIAPTFTSETETIWFDDTAVKFAAEWLHEHEQTVWTPFPEFGKLLSEKSDRKFFHRQGLCGKLSIEDYDGKEGCILATQSNYLGRNLQDRYSQALVFGVSGRADVLEQQAGRFHRQGQKSESVEIIFYLGSIENYEALMRARERAKYDATMNRNERSKLLTCDWLVPDWSEISKLTGPRWKK